METLHRQTTAENVRASDAGISVSFSSEYPVFRAAYGKYEILEHSATSIDLERARDGLPLLLQHDANSIPVGRVNNVRLEAGRLRGEITTFSTNEGKTAATLLREGHRELSFGYVVSAETDATATIDGREEPAYRATKWMPYEVSIVSIPADPTIGVNRSMQDEQQIAVDEAEVEVAAEETVEEVEQEQEEPRQEAPRSAHIEIKSRSLEMESNKRAAEILKIAKRFGAYDLAAAAIERGDSIDTFRAQLLDVVADKPAKIQESRMDEQDTRGFDLGAVIRAEVYPNKRQFREAAQESYEICDAMARSHGHSAGEGVYIPHALLGKRAGEHIAATPGVGGNIVSTELNASSFIDVLRGEMFLTKVGATFLPGLTGNQAIPKLTAGATGSWMADELTAPSKSTLTIGQVTMSPKQASCHGEYSRRLFLQSTPAIDALLTRDLATGLAYTISAAALNGTGSNGQPKGITAYTTGAGLNVSDFAAATPTYDEVVAMRTAIRSDKVMGPLSFVAGASMTGRLLTTEQFSGSNGMPILNNDRVIGFPYFECEQVTTDDLILGHWADLMVGLWGGLELIVNPYALDTAGAVRITVHQNVDVAVRHIESFCRGYVATP